MIKVPTEIENKESKCFISFYNFLFHYQTFEFRNVSKDRNCISTVPLHDGRLDKPSSSGHSNWHPQSNENSESNGGSWRKEKSKSGRNRSNERSSRNRRHRSVLYIIILMCVIFIQLLLFRNNSEKSSLHKFENVGGIIKLPPNVNVSTNDSGPLSLNGYLKSVPSTASSSPHPSKQLFNPNNPNKPIVISPKQQNTRAGYTTTSTESHHVKDQYPININSTNTQQYSGAHFGTPPPAWYDPYTDRYYSKNCVLKCHAFTHFR